MFMRIITIAILFSISILPQQYEFEKVIGSFTNASSFAIDPSGSFYISDIQTDEVYKLNAQGELLKDNGGYGWDEESFDDPVSIVYSGLNIYVADRNNKRVKLYDRDLNFIGILPDNEDQSLLMPEFDYPTSIGVNNRGELVLLDAENRMILIFTAQGRFNTTIGDYKYKDYKLVSPWKVRLDNNNNIYILDSNYVIMYDEFGNGLTKIQTPKGTNNFFVMNMDNIYYVVNNTIYYNNNPLPLNLSDDIEIIDIIVKNDKIFILTPKNIQIYKKL